MAIGVDAHRPEHVVVAINQTGCWSLRSLFSSDYLRIPGYRAMDPEWGSLGPFEIECTESYGGGVARSSLRRGYIVEEVNQPAS